MRRVAGKATNASLMTDHLFALVASSDVVYWFLCSESFFTPLIQCCRDCVHKVRDRVPLHGAHTLPQILQNACPGMGCCGVREQGLLESVHRSSVALWWWYVKATRKCTWGLSSKASTRQSVDQNGRLSDVSSPQTRERPAIAKHSASTPDQSSKVRDCVGILAQVIAQR